MDVTFEQETPNGVYVAKFSISSDSNIHIEEDVPASKLRIYQSGVEDGTYVAVTTLQPYGTAFDFDLTGLVYPKYIKLESLTPVKSCVVS